MKKTQFTVGEVSKITGISKDTLRYYDRIGLFQPALKDPHNGYRYYTIDQFWYMDIITCFRKLGMSIEKIKKTLSYKDNSHIVAILNEQRQEAEKMRDYYAGVMEDIQWYCEQDQKIAGSRPVSAVQVELLPERRVICGINPDDEQAYLITLQEKSQEEILHASSIKRSYGYFLHPEDIRSNYFHIHGIYLSIGTGNYSHTQQSDILTLPAGRYACFIANVCGGSADFSPLVRWLDETGETSQFILADEIGLQLFYYNQFNYPCEIKAYLGPEPAPVL